MLEKGWAEYTSETVAGRSVPGHREDPSRPSTSDAASSVVGCSERTTPTHWYELMADYTPYQKKIINRYYKNFDAIKHQQLSELATELYLAEGKKKLTLWKRVAESLRKLDFPESRIAHLIEKQDPSLLVGILRELENRASGG